jgi:triosephosphate isomerase (TIM)
MNRTPIIGGNWKMNTDSRSARELARGVHERLTADGKVGAGRGRAEVWVFPPFPYLLEVSDELRRHGSAVGVGAQGFYPAKNGAYTGEVSLEMVVDCGCRAVLVGHSERRHVIKEPEELINAKVRAALGAGPAMPLVCVLCIGETLGQRDAGETDAVNERQLRSGLAGVDATQLGRLVIAYEPVWAIGTGKTATPGDARDAHAGIRRVLSRMYSDDAAESVRIQYGGSVNAANARSLFTQPGVDGGLIGGASLKVDEFCAIVGAAAGG